jgi:hypothetical protein
MGKQWFNNIRWDEAMMYVAGAALAAGGAVVQTGGTWRQAQTAAAAAALIAAGAFLRNPKNLEWKSAEQPQAEQTPVEGEAEAPRPAGLTFALPDRVKDSPLVEFLTAPKDEESKKS